MTDQDSDALAEMSHAEWVDQIRDERVEALIAALTKIAAFDDRSASEHLAKNGSYAMFDEPHSVEIARKALISHQDKAD
jgi:hypothetical protein